MATKDQHQIALFFTGQKHAGENLTDLLAQRNAELAAPIEMCDGPSRNLPEEFATLLARCNAHARRKFIDVESSFPDEVRHVLETVAKVYRNDAIAKERNLSDHDRLRFHQAEAAPLLDGLKRWFAEQFVARTIEPNSVLGDAIEYMTKHWDALTLFLRVPGAPLDNNVCERVLKKAILHRKTALFYKTLNGARVGDLFMSIIHTAELAKIDVFGYLVALQRHHERVAEDPPRGCLGTTGARWLWSLRATLQRNFGATAHAGHPAARHRCGARHACATDGHVVVRRACSTS